MKTGYKITNGKGFHISFTNGLTISVQFGPGNYCSNKKLVQMRNQPENYECSNAEVAIFATQDIKGAKWLTNKFLPKYRGVDVVGYIEPDELAGLINRVQKSRLVIAES